MIDGTLTQDATQGTSKLEANGETARSDFDYLTVLQDIAGGDISAKFYLTDNVFSGDEEAIASNPLIGLTDDELLGAVVGQGELSLMKFMFNEDTAFDALFDAELAVVTLSDTDIDDRNQSSEAARNVRSVQNSPEADIYVQADTLDSSLFVTLNSELEIAVEALQDGPVVPQFYSTLSSLPAIRFSQDGGQSVAQAELEAQAEAEAAAQAELEAQAQAEAEAAAQAELEAQVQIRVSHKTEGGDTINSTDGYDLSADNYGELYTVKGNEMDIAGVSNNAKISYVYHDANTVEVTLDTPWNSVKNIEISSENSANITLNNFVHTDVSLGGEGGSTVIINGAKRGNITTGGSDDVVEVNAQTNGPGWGNDFTVNTGEGADTITAIGDKGHSGFNIDAGDDNDNVTVGGSYDGSNIQLGQGSDVFTGGDGNDTVNGGDDADVLQGGNGDDILNGGAGNDVIQGGGGNDILEGGTGNDTFIIQAGDGNTTIKDFGGVGGGGSGEADLMPHHDTIKLQGAGLDAENMLLEYDGKNTIVTFEGVEGFSITLDNFDFTDLDNLPNVQGWNFIFDGQDTGSDAYDVFNNHGTGQAGVWNNDIVTHLNDADNKVSGRDDSDDVINAMNGDDVVSGGTGDDVLRGQAGDDVLYGDDAEDTGSSQVTTTIDVTYVSTTAGYRNAIGAYTVDSNGKILGVSIGIEDQHAADAGEHFTIEVSGPEAAGVGYFILSDGYNKNAAFFDRYDSDDGEYSFLYKAGTEEERSANISDDPNDISLSFTANDGEVISLNGNAYHSNAALNHDGSDHVTTADNGDGTTRLGFEDLPNLGDADFTDVVIDVSVAHDTIYTLPDKSGGDDRLVGGAGNDKLIGQGGDDILEGGEGSDIAVFSGLHSEYEFIFNENGSITVIDKVEGRDGTDTLMDVESIAFRDGNIDATPEALIIPAVDNADADEAQAEAEAAAQAELEAQAQAEAEAAAQAELEAQAQAEAEAAAQAELEAQAQAEAEAAAQAELEAQAQAEAEAAAQAELEAQAQAEEEAAARAELEAQAQAEAEAAAQAELEAQAQAEAEAAAQAELEAQAQAEAEAAAQAELEAQAQAEAEAAAQAELEAQAQAEAEAAAQAELEAQAQAEAEAAAQAELEAQAQAEAEAAAQAELEAQAQAEAEAAAQAELEAQAQAEAEAAAGIDMQLVSVNDWYNPNWGGGYNATFQITLTEEMVVGDSVEGWSINLGFNNAQGTITSGWLDGFNGSVDFDASAGVFTNEGQDYQPSLGVGETIQFTVQVQDVGFNADDFSLTFNDLDPEMDSEDTDLTVDAQVDVAGHDVAGADVDVNLDVVEAITGDIDVEVDAGVVLNGNNGKDVLKGGSGNDVLDGGNGKDDLTGGGGDDVLYGGRGKDTARFSGDFEDYRITENDDGSYQIADGIEGRDGIDTILDIEFADFNGSIYDVGGKDWLSATDESESASMMNFEAMQNGNWLDNVDNKSDDTDSGAAFASGHKANVDEAVVDIADITPDAAEQSDDNVCI